MTKESFNRAEELLPLIADTKAQIAKWESALSFKYSGEIPTNFETKNGYTWVSAKHLPFEIAKVLSIAGFKKELEQLEKEFNSL